MPNLEPNPSSDDFELLVEISQLFTLQDLMVVLRKVVDLSAKVVGATDASLILFHNDHVDWQYIINISEDDPERAAEIVKHILDKGLAGWVVCHQQIALIEDTLEDPRWYTFLDHDPHPRSALCIPLIYQDSLLAVMTLVHVQPGYFNAHHLRLMTIIANQAALAIHNARMFSRVQAQQHQLEIMLNAIPDILLILDGDGQILIANDAALPLLGAEKRTDVLGCRLDDLTHADEVLQSLQDTLYTTEGTEPQRGFEARSERLRRDFYVMISPWENKQQATSGCVVIMHDISSLRDLNRFKDEMLRLASHDLRSPLALIVGYIDMIAMDTPDPHSPVHQHIDVIRRSTTRMSNLLEELLRVEQVRRSPLELHEKLDPYKLVKVALVNMRPIAERKRLKFQAHTEPGKRLSIIGDPVLIRQAMENLLDNAIKYTAAGGSVTVYASTKDGFFNFIVEDTGIGIPQENLPHIFESFYRVQQPGTEQISGTGLGLSLVKEVIERHGGQVSVTSEPGKGSRFGFNLPLHDRTF